MWALIVGIGYLLWQLIKLLWQFLKWSWKWFFAPCVLGIILYWGVYLFSIIPLLGTFLHGGIVIYIYKFTNMVEGIQPTVLSILMYGTLLLVLIDCINDLRITIRYRLFIADTVLTNKYKFCAALPAIGAAVFYYMSDKTIQGILQSIVTNRDILLLLIVAPRTLFIIAEIYAVIFVYPNVNKLIKSNDFFKEQYGHDTFYRRGKSTYLGLKHDGGMVLSNESIIKRETMISTDKLEKMYPKKFLAKAVEFFVGDKETIAKRERAEGELEIMRNKVSYISKKGYKKFSGMAEEFLRQVSSMSPRDLIEMKFPDKYNSWLSLGVEFFLIKVFNSGVIKGNIVDENKSDYPMENHAYRHTESVAQVKVTDANKDPRLALDDDD